MEVDNNNPKEKLTSEQRYANTKKKKEYRKEEKVAQRLIIKSERDYEKERERDPKALALLRGKNLRYLMRTKEMILGRETIDTKVDVNLLLEGTLTGMKISRKQAIIKIKRDGEFYVKNIGKRTIFVNGKPIEYNKKKKLQDNSLIEICELGLVFEINKIMHTRIKRQLINQNLSNSN